MTRSLRLIYFIYSLWRKYIFHIKINRRDFRSVQTGDKITATKYSFNTVYPWASHCCFFCVHKTTLIRHPPSSCDLDKTLITITSVNIYVSLHNYTVIITGIILILAHDYTWIRCHFELVSSLTELFYFSQQQCWW